MSESNGYFQACPIDRHANRIGDRITSLEEKLEKLVDALLEKATDSNRIDVNVVHTQLRDYRIILLSSVAISGIISLSTVFWFTGLEPYLQANGYIISTHKHFSQAENGKD